VATGSAAPASSKPWGFPAVEGWYSTNASSHMWEDKSLEDCVKKFNEKYNTLPNDYSITAYDGALVILDAIKRVAESGKDMNRSNVRGRRASYRSRLCKGWCHSMKTVTSRIARSVCSGSVRTQTSRKTTCTR
jgi:hypothetical protein